MNKLKSYKNEICFLLGFLFIDLLIASLEYSAQVPAIMGPIYGVSAAYAVAYGYRTLPLIAFATLFIHTPILLFQFANITPKTILSVSLGALFTNLLISFLFIKFQHKKIIEKDLFKHVPLKSIRMLLIALAGCILPTFISYYYLIHTGGYTEHNAFLGAIRLSIGIFFGILAITPILMCIIHPVSRKYFTKLHLVMFAICFSMTLGILYLVEVNNNLDLKREFLIYSEDVSSKNNQRIIKNVDLLRQIRTNIYLFPKISKRDIAKDFLSKHNQHFFETLVFAKKIRINNDKFIFRSVDAQQLNENSIDLTDQLSEMVFELTLGELSSFDGLFIPIEREGPQSRALLTLPYELISESGAREIHLIGGVVDLNKLLETSIQEIFGNSSRHLAYAQDLKFKFETGSVDISNENLSDVNKNKVTDIKRFKYNSKFSYLNLSTSLQFKIPALPTRTNSSVYYWLLLLVVGLVHYFLMRMQFFLLLNDKNLSHTLVSLKNEVTSKEFAEQRVLELNKSLEEKVFQRTEELSKRTRELETIFKVIPDALLKVNSRAQILNIESYSLDSTSLNLMLQPNSILTDLLTENDQTTLHELIELTIKMDLMNSCVLQFRKDIKILICELTITKLDGETALIIVRDITEKEKLQKKIELQNIQALNHAKLASLGEMAAGIAHEINNPLTIIDGSAQILQKLISNKQVRGREKADSSLLRIQRTVYRIASIVNGLKKYAREDNTKIEEVDLKSFIEETMSFCKERFSNNGIKLSVDILTTQKRLFCSPIELSQVLVNLLNNAYDAISPLEDRWVRVEISEDKNNHIIKVCDSGPGIPKEIRNKIMEPFFTTKVVGQGTGLGLSISQGIVQNHGGTLSVNDCGGNTCFKIMIPKSKLKIVAL